MIDRDLLLATLNYDPLSGVFTWRTDRPQSHFKTYNAFRVYQGKYSGKVAGCVQSNGSVDWENENQYSSHHGKPNKQSEK